MRIFCLLSGQVQRTIITDSKLKFIHIQTVSYNHTHWPLVLWTWPKQYSENGILEKQTRDNEATNRIRRNLDGNTNSFDTHLDKFHFRWLKLKIRNLDFSSDEAGFHQLNLSETFIFGGLKYIIWCLIPISIALCVHHLKWESS